MKMNVPVDDFFSECEPIHRKLLVCSMFTFTRKILTQKLTCSISLEKESVPNYSIFKPATEKTRYEGQGILILVVPTPLIFVTRIPVGI